MVFPNWFYLEICVRAATNAIAAGRKKIDVAGREWSACACLASLQLLHEHVFLTVSRFHGAYITIVPGL